jgi:cytochrome c5
VSAPRGPGAAHPAQDRGAVTRRAAAVALVLASVALAALTSLPGDSRSAGNRAAYPDTFPAGPGRAIAERSCLFCHSPMLVTQQAKDSTGWEKSLATMEKWGAPVAAAEHDTLRGYLLAHFGPRMPAIKN